MGKIVWKETSFAEDGRVIVHRTAFTVDGEPCPWPDHGKAMTIGEAFSTEPENAGNPTHQDLNSPEQSDEHILDAKHHH